MKKKVLIVYYSMMMGGSTTSLLGLLNNINNDKYEVYLQLYKNEGELIEYIPSHVRLLPEAFKHQGHLGNIIKTLKLLFSLYWLKALYYNKKHHLPGLSHQVMSDFQVKKLSRMNKNEYDYAIGFLEGWSDRYLAFNVVSNKKYAWLHNTYTKICPITELDSSWMERVDKIVCVADSCLEDFIQYHPEMAEKSILVNNIIDSKIIRKRSEIDLSDDPDYIYFINSKDVRIVTVCRLMMSSKGLDRAVNCAIQLKKTGIKFLWYVIGDGDDRRTIQDMIDKYRISDCFKLVGIKMNPYPFMKNANFLCVTSRWEGKPMVVTESMILGTPPVVTEYLSAREQIIESEEGLVCNNDDESIYELLSYCLTNPNKLEEIKNTLISREYGNSDYIRTIERELL